MTTAEETQSRTAGARQVSADRFEAILQELADRGAAANADEQS